VHEEAVTTQRDSHFPKRQSLPKETVTSQRDSHFPKRQSLPKEEATGQEKMGEKVEE